MNGIPYLAQVGLKSLVLNLSTFAGYEMDDETASNCAWAILGATTTLAFAYDRINSYSNNNATLWKPSKQSAGYNTIEPEFTKAALSPM